MERICSEFAEKLVRIIWREFGENFGENMERILREYGENLKRIWREYGENL